MAIVRDYTRNKNGGFLIGTGGHGHDIWETLNHSIPTIYPWRWADHHTDWYPTGGGIIIGINDPQLRFQVYEAMRLPVPDNTWIHPAALIQDSTIIDAGTHINYGVTMTRTTIGHHTTISPGVTICGDVTIGDRVLIGAGSTICDRVTIGNDVTIGAGAVVLPETVIPDGETWFGVPAKTKS